MASTREIRTKFKRFFSSRQASDEGVEILRKFILPFTQAMPGKGLGIDDVLKAFFALDERIFVYARATRDFKIPGSLFITGRRATKTHGQNVWMRRGQVALLALDRKDAQVRMEVVYEKERLNFRLEKFEFETIKDWLEVIGESTEFGFGNNRAKPISGPDYRNRFFRRRKILRRRRKSRKNAQQRKRRRTRKTVR